MKDGLKIGAKAEHRFTVEERHTVRALFSEEGAFPTMPAVFATAYMTGLMEWACVEIVKPFYENDDDSLGTHVDFSHLAPTLPGQVVTVTAEVTEFDGRFIWFRVQAHDGIDLIGEGRHQRALIKTEKFAHRLAAKRASAGLEG
ncbi:thioesterase family protein [Gemmobacter serpentinus]|uniref:thioesterase family protein n=1 Tax=Gemmobacter serpentinus TaxID=2652247 RepID=UPI00124E6F4D|nr:thioesterase family protein [Gemmobacter serpentinus]